MSGDLGAQCGGAEASICLAPIEKSQFVTDRNVTESAGRRRAGRAIRGSPSTSTGTTVSPKGKHDDQVDSTAQFLDWFKRPFAGQGIYEHYRQLAQAAEQRCKPQPTQTVWAPALWNGSPR